MHAAVKGAATQLVAKWSKVQAAKVAETKNGSSAGAVPATAAKRKADTPDSESVASVAPVRLEVDLTYLAVPAKKAKTAAPPVKKPTPIPAAPKVALPKFQKAPAPAEPPRPAFMAALAGLQKPAASSSSAADDATVTKATAPKSSVAVKKKKKTVHWPKDDAKLCDYREIEAREMPESDAEVSCRVPS